MNLGGYRTIALFVSAALLAGACGSGEEPDTPTASVPVATAEPTTTAAATDAPTEAADPFAIPDEIDEAYVERVLEELSTTLARAVALTVEEGEVNAKVRRELASSYRAEKALPGIVAAIRNAVRGTKPRELFNRNAQGIDMLAVDLVTGSSSCIWVEVRQDLSDLFQQEVDPFKAYYHLQTKRSGEDPQGRNATPWMIVAEVRPRNDGKEYRDPCE